MSIIYTANQNTLLKSADLEIVVAPIKVMPSQLFGYAWEISNHNHLNNGPLFDISQFFFHRKFIIIIAQIMITYCHYSICQCVCTGPEIVGLLCSNNFSNSRPTPKYRTFPYVWHPLHAQGRMTRQTHVQHLLGTVLDFIWLF